MAHSESMTTISHRIHQHPCQHSEPFWDPSHRKKGKNDDTGKRSSRPSSGDCYRNSYCYLSSSQKAILIDDIDNFDPTILNSSSKIGITASASSPEILVSKMLAKIGQQFDLNIIESEYEKENIHFKIPQKLKEVV